MTILPAEEEVVMVSYFHHMITMSLKLIFKFYLTLNMSVGRKREFVTITAQKHLKKMVWIIYFRFRMNGNQH